MDGFNKLAILNNLGQVIREEEISFKNNRAILTTGDLPAGCYLLQLKSVSSGTVSIRFILAR